MSLRQRETGQQEKGHDDSGKVEITGKELELKTKFTGNN